MVVCFVQSTVITSSIVCVGENNNFLGGERLYMHDAMQRQTLNSLA
jgi:hypothetical protein